ncbi:MAG: outer membrane beta-barrel family protein, partial [Bacteroidota bacterium]
KNQSQLERFIQEEWSIDSRTQIDLQNIETIGAAYFSVNYQFHEKADISLATRYEYWRQDFSDNTTDRRAGRLFPSAGFTYDISATQQFNLSYTSRINRPNFSDLASYLRYSDPISFFTGNPRLRPTISHRVAARYRLGSVQWGIAYQYEDNPIAHYQLGREEGNDFILVLPQNVDYQRAIEGQINLPIDIKPWWSMSLNATLGLRVIRVNHTRVPAKASYTTTTVNGNQQFSLPKDWSIEVSGWYNSGFFVGSTKFRGFGAINLGIKKELPLSKGSLQLSVEDLFKTQLFRSSFGYLGEQYFDILGDVRFRSEAGRYRIIRLSYFRSFGSGRQTIAQRAASDERTRLGN